MTTFKLRNQVTGFLLLTFTLPAVLLCAQPINNLIGDLAIPAPNVASLGRYGDVPVSHYTGVPRIEVPINTLEEGPLTLPVFLNYHARGIQVAETASWAGAGWRLQAGGMISRTMPGYPDERSPYGYYLNGENLNGSFQELIQLLERAEIDTEPDIFAFSIPGYGGKFYIDKDHNCQLVPRQDLKITWSENFEQFTLLTPDGNRYIFGKPPRAILWRWTIPSCRTRPLKLPVPGTWARGVCYSPKREPQPKVSTLPTPYCQSFQAGLICAKKRDGKKEIQQGLEAEVPDHAGQLAKQSGGLCLPTRITQGDPL